MSFYVGEAESSLDEKNRLTIPKKFRKLMPAQPEGDTIIWVIPGYRDSEFMLMDDEVGSCWARALTAKSIGGGSAGRQKLMLARSERIEVDKTGRALIPSSFLERCAVTEREFIITGHGDHLEVYGRERWAKMQSELTQQVIDDLWDEIGEVRGG